MLINVDGIPLAKSSGSQFWPVLGAIAQLDNTPPFIIAAYHGHNKPECCNVYLEQFVAEANYLLTNGIIFQDRKLKIEFLAFVCDAPARSFIKKIKCHTGYFGCDKCIQKGCYVENRVVFPQMDAPLRTDGGFIWQENEEHHTGRSILENILKIKMVSHFPHDYMHLVCLGAMRKLVLLWMRGKLPIRLSSHQINQVSCTLVRISKLVPNEFARKPRSLREVDRWKATEFRQLLLYTGPFVLKSSIRKKYYTHYLALACAIRILVSPQLAVTEANDAQKLLEYFVEHYETLYGREQLSYNVHNLIHLANDVARLGHVDLFSAFKFENYLQEVKRLVRKSPLPLQQLIRRICEEREAAGRKHLNPLHEKFPLLQGTHFNGPLVNRTSNPQYTKVIYPQFTIALFENANCVQLKNGSICIIENIATSTENTVIIGKQFLEMRDFFTKPYKSSIVGIYKVSQLSNERQTWNLEDIVHKAMKLPIDENTFYVVILLHD